MFPFDVWQILVIVTGVDAVYHCRRVPLTFGRACWRVVCYCGRGLKVAATWYVAHSYIAIERDDGTIYVGSFGYTWFEPKERGHD